MRGKVRDDLPRQTLLVIAVDLTGFLEFGNEFLDVFGRVVGVEVDDDCVDHFEGLSV